MPSLASFLCCVFPWHGRPTLFPDASFNLPSTFIFQVHSQVLSTFFDLKTAHFQPPPHLCTPMLLILQSSFLPFDQHIYTLSTAMFLTYLIQHKQPILPLPHPHPEQSVCSQQGFGTPARAQFQGPWLLSSPLPSQAGAARDWVLGPEVWVICY